MTLEQAVEVLNANRHRGYSKWSACGGYACTFIDLTNADALTEFEAIVLALYYLNEGKSKGHRSGDF